MAVQSVSNWLWFSICLQIPFLRSSSLRLLLVASFKISTIFLSSWLSVCCDCHFCFVAFDSVINFPTFSWCWEVEIPWLHIFISRSHLFRRESRRKCSCLIGVVIHLECVCVCVLRIHPIDHYRWAESWSIISWSEYSILANNSDSTWRRLHLILWSELSFRLRLLQVFS